MCILRGWNANINHAAYSAHVTALLRGHNQVAYPWLQKDTGQRHTLYALRKQGLSERQIARQLGLSTSEFSRELTRNRSADGTNTAEVAEAFAVDGRSTSGG